MRVFLTTVYNIINRNNNEIPIKKTSTNILLCELSHYTLSAETTTLFTTFIVNESYNYDIFRPSACWCPSGPAHPSNITSWKKAHCETPLHVEFYVTYNDRRHWAQNVNKRHWKLQYMKSRFTLFMLLGRLWS